MLLMVQKCSSHYVIHHLNLLNYTFFTLNTSEEIDEITLSAEDNEDSSESSIHLSKGFVKMKTSFLRK